MSEPVYPTVDPAELEPEYSEHKRAIEAVAQNGDGWVTKGIAFAATQLAIRDRENKRLKEEVAGLKCVRGYQADWIAINKALDEHRRAVEREIRQCRGCGCLVAGGPSACVRCAEAGEAIEDARGRA